MRTPHNRPGFTLIELLVVIIIILVLATLTVAITPKIAGEQKVAKAADQVQGWLLIAKSRAKRDQIPTGIRLHLDPNKHVRELQYIQQPDDYVGGSVQANLPNLKRVNATSVDFTGGFTDPRAFPVQPGDYIEFKGGGSVHQIDPTSTVTPVSLLLSTALAHQLAWTSEYRIIRKPRALIGETPMLLAQDMIIDVNANLNPAYNAPLPPINTNDPLKLDDDTVDIVFSPSGSLVTAPGNSSFVPLWLRDVTADAPPTLPWFSGDPVLICIYKRAGFIAAHPADKSGADPYTFARDGKSSGL